MASTGEPDRKRRHFSSISPTAAAAAAVKKQPFFWPSSEDKLDTAVLQFQNLKLSQKLEAQQVECSLIEDRLSLTTQKQRPYESTLKIVQKSWERLITAVESSSVHVRELRGEYDKGVLDREDGSPTSLEDDFIRRILETGATETSGSCSNQLEEKSGQLPDQVTKTLCNLVVATDDLKRLKGGLYPAVLQEGMENGLCRKQASDELESEVKRLRLVLSDVHVKHKSLSSELQNQQDADVKNKAEFKRIREELDGEVVELQQCNGELAALRAERDATMGTFFPVMNVGNKLVTDDRVRDKQRDLQDMESVIKELTELASSRLQELKDLHEKRMAILERLSNLQNTLKSVRCISSSQACLSLKDQLTKSKEAALQYQALLVKLQVEKDNIIWRERELGMKSELVDVSRRSSAAADARIASLTAEIEKQQDEKKRITTRLKEISGERGRKEIFADMKALISSFPEEMSSMQSQLGKYKETAGGIHSLRTDVQSLSWVLDRKKKECEVLSVRSAGHASHINDLKATVRDLKDSHEELKLFLDMYKRESTDLSKDIAEAKDQEYKAWAHVQSLKSCLDEQNLELRVKAAIEEEAISQQMLAAAEAEIADLRHKLENSKRDVKQHAEILKSKHEENETYLSEIQTIGRAYEDILPQNQQLLLQVTERDDYNIKLFLEGLTSKQMQKALLIDRSIMEKDMQRASTSVNIFFTKSSKIEDQLRFCIDQVRKLAEDRYQKSVTLENMQKKWVDVRNSLEQARTRLEESQSKVEKSRMDYGAMELDLETERFSRRRVEEEMEIGKRKVVRLRSLIEGSLAVQKLREELGEYKEILKCKVCNDRPKQVVITKCYHLFCNQCVQKITGSRHRKCPTCSASFGPNDVKPVYI